MLIRSLSFPSRFTERKSCPKRESNIPKVALVTGRIRSENQFLQAQCIVPCLIRHIPLRMAQQANVDKKTH